MARLCQAHSFELEEDTSGYGEYVRGGIVTQHKEAKTLAFRGLAEAAASPGEFLFSDFSKLERPALLHAGFQALDAFQVWRPLFSLFLGGSPPGKQAGRSRPGGAACWIREMRPDSTMRKNRHADVRKGSCLFSPVPIC